MTVIIDGTAGITDVNGSASAPAITGVTTNTGVYFGTNTIGLSTNGTAAVFIDSSGNLGVNTISPSKKVEVYATSNSLQIESIVRNDNTGTGVAAIGFNVSGSAGSETTSTKAGIGLVRSAGYGVGSLCFYNNTTSSAGDFTTADERMRIDTNNNLQFNSGYGSVAIAYGCRAWVRFTGSSGAVVGSGNVTSITRNAAGDYTVNFTNAMPDANYAAIGTAHSGGTGSGNGGILVLAESTATPQTTGSVRMNAYIKGWGSFQDSDVCNVTVFR